jgi:hypothetical protein
MEHNFMMSERGRRDFNNQLMQLVGSIQYTNDLDVHMALITAPNYERTEVEKYAYTDSDPTQVLRKYVDMFGMCQKNPNGLDVLIEDSREIFKKWGASEPTFMLTNSKLGYQQNMTLEKTQYITNGADGIKRLKAGPELKSYRGLNVINSRHFSMEAGRQPRDLLNRRVRVAEHYKLPPMTATELAGNTVLLYDQGRDQMAPVSCKELYESSRLTYDDPHVDDDPTFDEIMSLENDKKLVPSGFWEHLFWNPNTMGGGEATSKSRYENFIDNEADFSSRICAYHPKFIINYHKAKQGGVDFTGVGGQPLFAVIMTGPTSLAAVVAREAVIPDVQFVKDMTAIFSFNEDEQLQMKAWLKFIAMSRIHQEGATPHGTCHMSCRLTAGDILTVATNERGFTDPNRRFMVWFYTGRFAHEGWVDDDAAAAMQQRGGPIDSDSIAYCMLMPYIARGYSRCENLVNLLTGGDAKVGVKKYSLMVVRPSIEHYMLGVIIGRGGTGELGATLWGQTELSCYDDAMHGKWGMNYKYHARAVVFNEKHLLRLWDIAFNGYLGGMGMKRVNWGDVEAWHEASVDLSEPLRSTFPDMFVMQFESDTRFDGDLPNPINFHSDGDPAAAGAMVDPENIHKTHSREMDVFGQYGIEGGMMSVANLARYREYKRRMPEYTTMHKQRKAAGHASHEGDTHTASLSFSGTMVVRGPHGQVILDQHGTGHLGDSFSGSASIRSGHGSMAAPGRPSTQRII